MANSEMVAAFRAERDAQMRRYESATGLPIEDKNRQEYRDYFGVGDCCGQPVERRVNLADFMRQWAARPEPEDESVIEIPPVYESDSLSRSYCRALDSGDLRTALLLGDALDDRLDVVKLTGTELAALALLEYEPAAREIVRRTIKRAQRRAEVAA